MATDAALKAFLDLTDQDLATYAATRAAEIGLILPETTLPAVCENLALLRAQTALFVAALGARAGESPQSFEP